MVIEIEKLYIEIFSDDQSETVEADKGLYQVMLYGEDVDQLEQTAEQLEALLVRVDGVIGLQRGSQPSHFGHSTEDCVASRTSC